MNYLPNENQADLISAITGTIEAIRAQRRERHKAQPHPLGKRFSQEELGEYAYPSYKNLLQGRTRRMPDRAALLRIADYLECSFAERAELLNAAQYAPEVPRTQQRKQITALSVDFSLSPALAGIDDVEKLAEVLATLRERLEPEVMRHGGVIIKTLVNGFLAAWGVNQAREDDPQQAVYAALALRAATLAAAPTFPADIHLRAGVHTDMALLGPRGKTHEFEIVGPSVNVATRLQERAESGAILISHSAYQHVRHMVEVEIVPQRVVPLSSAIYRVTSRAKLAHEAEAYATPLVGRAEEMATLAAGLERLLEQPTLAVMTLVGEAGIGKSRLLYEFINWVQRAHPAVTYFSARASSSSQHIVNIMLCEMFVNRLHLMADDSLEDVGRKFEASFAAAMGASDEVVAKAHIMCHYLGYEPGSPYARAYGDDLRLLRDHALHILAEYLTALSDQMPVVLVLEDLHWADDSSLELLNRLFKLLLEQSIYVIATARPALFTPGREWGVPGVAHHRLALAPLNEEHSRALLANLVGPTAQLSADALQFIAQRADGNPFYLEELLAMLIERGVIGPGAPDWAKLGESQAVPTTITSLLQARLEMLPETERHMLQAAAVIGRTFWDDALIDVLLRDDQTRASARRHVAMGLDALRRRDLIVLRPDSSFRTTQEYLFRHALMRDAAYAMLLLRDRQHHHRRAAAWLQESIARGAFTEEYSSVVATHYEQGNQIDEAIRWYQRATAYALSRCAHAVAISLSSNAIRLAENAPAFRNAWLTSLIDRTNSHRVLGEAAAWRAGLDMLTGAISEADPLALRARAALMQAEYHLNSGANAEAAQAAQQAILLAHTGASAAEEIEACLLLAAAHERADNLAYARDLALQALRLASGAHLDPHKARALHQLGAYNTQLGEYRAARTVLHQALTLSSGRLDRSGQAAATSELARLEYRLGNGNKARTQAMAALESYLQIGDAAGVGRTLLLMADISSSSGDYAAAEPIYRRALEQAQRLEDAYLSIEVQTHAGAALLSLGRTGEALAIVQEACHAAEAAHYPMLLAAAMQARARILLEMDAGKKGSSSNSA